jgi:uncharacterized Ntn-hydrolase superfamily protein
VGRFLLNWEFRFRNVELRLVVVATAVALAGIGAQASGARAFGARALSARAFSAPAFGARAFQASEPLWETGTFSILGYDPATGELGGAVQSRVFSVGNGVLWADASAGIAATQAIVDVSYGPQALELLRKGLAPSAIVKQIWERDPDPLPDNWTKQGRQFAVMNLKGEYAAFTGTKASEWAGHKSGKYATAQGNILAGPAVVGNMIDAFEHASGHLSQRLVAALEGGQAGGGDKRGQQSAAIVIVKKNCGVWLHNDTVLRLQVDDNPEPIKELKRLVDLWNTRKPRSVTPECLAAR